MGAEQQNHGIMVIWHGVADGAETDYLDWHTSEHMLERIEIPGFLRGCGSYTKESKLHPWITIYEGDGVDVFGSQEYFARLNNLTAWSSRMHPNIINFIRGACDVIVSRGVGEGRSTLSVRLGFGRLSRADLERSAARLCDLVGKLQFVTSVKFCVARHDVSGAKTKEAELRGTAGDLFEGVLLVDSHSDESLHRHKADVVEFVKAAGLTVADSDVAVYDLHYLVNAREPQCCRGIVRAS